ncbi:putative flagellum biosynthesis repressor protein FlbT [Thalassobaculum fulvum]|jgi:flagellar protein FlbT|uniref:Flagellum biosynthesis repressor protein FlbT n=1 Tax=Thalassobaculum fulvum TaxID=1633335 RepID=A0A918XW64_9PROT|nr:flagellar biosynthesis repressor FlbT [Thalassobaculum fulvum]GHD60896.1 putative flagellum biosynthesis repressor protein FlbT [Thalassobaculum fulvum]
MPLKVNIKPGEKFVVNGAVMVAGNKGASLILQNEATILLGKDIMQEDEANTPARRIYFTILLMYLDDTDRKKYYPTFMKLIEDFMEATTFNEVRKTLLHIVQDVNGGKYYRALKTCKALMTYESEVLAFGQNQGSSPDLNALAAAHDDR